MKLLLAASTALLLILSYPPFDYGPVAWVALLPWLLLIERSKSKGAFFYSLLVGTLFFGGTVWWLGYPAFGAAPAVVILLAPYFALWGLLAHRLLSSVVHRPSSIVSLLSLPSLWVLMEWVRSFFPFSGFGWNLLAHTQWNWTALIQLADLTGAYGVSFLVVMVNVALFQTLRAWRGRGQETRGVGKRIVPLVVSGLCILAVLTYGTIRIGQIDKALAPCPLSPAPVFKVAVVQGNIPQYQKWDQAYEEKIWNRYETLTLEAAKKNPDLIVWPETAVPDFLGEGEVFERLSRLAWSFQVPLLIGAPVGEWDTSSRMFNSAVLFGREGQLLERYDKIHLVPFGEFVPFRRWFGWLYRHFSIGEFSPGQDFTVFHLSPVTRHLSPVTHDPSPVTRDPSPSFSVLICFEDLFGPLSRRFLREGAQVLFVITNDAWFERSAASLQHLQASVFRAVEGHVWVGRAANTGWSGFVDPAGRRMPLPQQVPRFQKGFATATLRTPLISTFQTRFGGWFEIFCAGVVGLTFLRLRRYNERS